MRRQLFLIKSCTLFMAVCLSFSQAIHADDFDRRQIERRIKPVGQVRIVQDVAAKPQAKEKTAEPPKGQAIYDKYCMVCHRTGLASAPKFRDTADWKARLAEKNVTALTASAIKGINAMPAKGTCIQCSDEEIKAAIEYMVPKQ